VFTGIGEFSIHKEFVSSKIAGEVASVRDPALDRLLDFAGDVGLLAIIHCDIDVPFAKEGVPPAYLDEMKDMLKRHPQTTIIWAHTGVGRVVHPIRARRQPSSRPIWLTAIPIVSSLEQTKLPRRIRRNMQQSSINTSRCGSC
jgi:predicted TIM-barrel fold metal-dependent hydrolase